MAVKLRLRRMGRRKHPIYAIVAADSRSPRDGRIIEDLGRYHVVDEPASLKLNVERVNYWLDQGAKPTDTVRSLLSGEGILLERYLRGKGFSDEQVAERLEAWRQEKVATAGDHKTTASDRAAAALEEERKRVEQEEAARRKAEAEARQKAEEEARKKAEEARKKAEEEAKAKAEEEAKAKAEEEAKAKEEAKADSGEEAEAPEAEAGEAKAESAETEAAASEEAEADDEKKED